MARTVDRRGAQGARKYSWILPPSVVTILTRRRSTIFFLLSRPSGLIGILLTLFILLLAVFGPLLGTADPTQVEIAARLQGPSAVHWLGTDQFGRDVLSRLVYGARYAVWVCLSSVMIAVVIGTAAGMVSGYYGGWLDQGISRVMDGLLALPSIFLALAVVSAFGPGIDKVILATGLVGIPRVARITRGSVISVKHREFVDAARAIGASAWRIQFHHILPNAAGPLMVFGALWAGTTLVYASGLSYLGVGVQPPTPEWGAMLADGQPYLLRAPMLSLYPGIAIAVFVLGLNLLGDSLRDYLDPGTRTRLQYG